MRWADGPLVAFDLETTSPNPFTALPVAYAFVRKDGGILKTLAELVNPGVPIPEGSTNIHGITYEDTQAGREMTEVVEELATNLLNVSLEGIPLVGMNLSFDLTIIDVLCKDLLDYTLDDIGWAGPVLDVFVLDKHFQRYRQGSRKLDALCHHYEVYLGENAHSPHADAKACLRVAVEMSKRYPGLRVKSAEELHRLQTFWHTEQLQNLSEYRVKKGQEGIPACDYGWPIHTGFTDDLESLAP